MTTPRAERVLRYNGQQVVIATRALLMLGVLIPADPASGAWWRVDPAWRADMDTPRRPQEPRRGHGRPGAEGQ